MQRQIAVYFETVGYIFACPIPEEFKSIKTGLKTASVIRRAYEKGRTATQDFKANMPILFDDVIPKWNYRAVPQ